jgi:signal transduction histidine kinase
MTNDRVNILLVDDQPARLLTYQSILGELGQNLVLARSGREALDKLMHDEFAVVLLDISMPDMDGFETAEMIHAHPRFEKTPIIFVTGIHVSELDRLRGYKAGAVDYVSIPVVPEILRSKVAVLVELYCKRHELRQLNRILANANKQLAEANLTLQAEKTRELEALNATLQRANAELERTNRSLQIEVVERARAEQALQEADRNKDEFLAMLAHELRNPLAPIHNALQLMRMQPSAGQSQWAQEVIQRQLAYLTRLVDDLLDVSRITRGKIELKIESIDVARVIASAVETSRPYVDAQQHSLVVSLPSEPLRLKGDFARVGQILANLVNNAAKYTDKGGQIVVTAVREGADVVFRVRDSGMGIPKEQLSSIFEPFRQIERTLDRSQGGLGIGLTLAKRLAEMQGGTISAYSEGPDHGSEFTVRLPGEFESRAVEAASMESALPPTSPLDLRVLIVDDNRDAAHSTAVLLRSAGCNVDLAYDGEEAVRVVPTVRPDVVLLDLGLPKLDGYQVAERIRADRSNGKSLIIALSGYGQDEHRLRSKLAGFDYHLVKPIEPTALTGLLASLWSCRKPDTASEAGFPLRESAH